MIYFLAPSSLWAKERSSQAKIKQETRTAAQIQSSCASQAKLRHLGRPPHVYMFSHTAQQTKYYVGNLYTRPCSFQLYSESQDTCFITSSSLDILSTSFFMFSEVLSWSRQLIFLGRALWNGCSRFKLLFTLVLQPCSYSACKTKKWEEGLEPKKGNNLCISVKEKEWRSTVIYTSKTWSIKLIVRRTSYNQALCWSLFKCVRAVKFSQVKWTSTRWQLPPLATFQIFFSKKLVNVENGAK